MTSVSIVAIISVRIANGETLTYFVQNEEVMKFHGLQRPLEVNKQDVFDYLGRTFGSQKGEHNSITFLMMSPTLISI